jgi:hypothetical protein
MRRLPQISAVLRGCRHGEQPVEDVERALGDKRGNPENREDALPDQPHDDEGNRAGQCGLSEAEAEPPNGGAGAAGCRSGTGGHNGGRAGRSGIGGHQAFRPLDQGVTKREMRPNSA